MAEINEILTRAVERTRGPMMSVGSPDVALCEKVRLVGDGLSAVAGAVAGGSETALQDSLASLLLVCSTWLGQMADSPEVPEAYSARSQNC